ncbi:MAG TPA: hypothetical protein VJV23_01550 [Candidatus Polarisedimenticolia bacterium]|nr:hypothetical protein [Candidatus Polarisedimenticolia bacterium]
MDTAETMVIASGLTCMHPTTAPSTGSTRRLIAALICAMAAASWVTEAGSIRGTIVVADKAGRGDPSRAVVWIDAPAGSAPPERAEIVMRNKVFEPALVVLSAGSTISFPNADPILHNVFSVSGGNGFDLGLYGKGEGRDVVLREPGVVRIYCNVHPQMEAFAVVTPGRWAARAGTDGAYAIEGVPPGKHDLKAWDERGGAASAMAVVSGDATVTVDFHLDATAFRRRPHLDKNGRPYQAGGREAY